MPTKKRIALAIIVVIVSASVLVPYYFSYLDTKKTIDAKYEELTKAPDPYSYSIPMYLRFNGTSPLGQQNESGIAFCLTFTYPNGTLVANEPVSIDSTAIIDYAYSSLDHVEIFFQNSLAYPLSYEENGLIPKQGSLSFSNPFSLAGTSVTVTNCSVGCNTQIYWPIEGDYTPLIGVFFTDGTNKTYSVDDVVMHVYPQEQLKELDTERVSLTATQASFKLSEAVFILGLVSVGALVVQILDHSESNSDKTQNASQTQNSPSIIEKPKTDPPSKPIEKKQDTNNPK